MNGSAARIANFSEGDTVTAAMYWFLLRPLWIGFHLLVVFGITVMIALGLWQLDRLDDRREFNAQVEARIDEPVVTIDALLAEAGDDPGNALAVADLEWRPIRAVGRYLPDEEVLIVNRSQNGRAGDNLVAPLLLEDGRILIVNRGFVPLGVERPAPPDGIVEVTGLARTSQQRRLGQLSDPAEGRLRELQRIDLDRLEQQLPGPVVPLSLELLQSDPPEPPGFPEPVIRPDLSDGPHLSYAVQWFIFAAAVAVGWVLAVRWSILRRRQVAANTQPSEQLSEQPSDQSAMN